MEIDWLIALCFLVPIAMFIFEQFAREIGGPKVFSPPYEQSDPITDEEFVALCCPGVKPETALKVRAIVAEQLAIPPERIRPEHRFVEDLLAD
ncbi:MAG: hypothetical protein ACKVHE_13890 [Planctomycetales bacterium]|jgi:hypothetical protein